MVIQVPRSSRPIPASVHDAAARARTFVSDGLPIREAGGNLAPHRSVLTEDVFTLGAKGGSTRSVHLLPPGVHPTTPAEAKLRFAWNEERQALWKRLEALAPTLREKFGISHVAFGGSYFSTDWANPGDMDGVAFYEPGALNAVAHPPRERPFQYFNRVYGGEDVHVYDFAESLIPPAGPRPLTAFSHAPPNPRPRQIELRGPMGPEVGTVLLDLAAFKAP